MSDHIPKGFAPITPYLVVKDPEGFLEFAKKGLGAVERSITRDGEGRFVHGELNLAGGILEFSQPNDAFGPTRTSLHVFVEDPDAVYARAIEHGATSLYEVMDHDYGERSGGVADAFGNQWFFARVTDQKKRDA